ncbi:MAG: hypothetical protein JWN04_1947 [Myxococcaceae bacterium]|nr:hypothetical protein [Myxococcaceae bacterium]
MTHFPPSLIHEKRRKILRYVGMALSSLMVLTVLTVFMFIMRNERAHDEETCPFSQLSDRSFGDGKVLEQQRTCVPGISERRYMVARTGKPTYELARKRLASDRFEPARYRWNLTPDAQGRLVLTVLVDGKVSSEFREEDAVHP